jgi:hypothetical protein
MMAEWTLLYMAPDVIKGDSDLIDLALKSSFGFALDPASTEIKADRAMVLKAVSYNGAMLQSAAMELRSDKEFVLEAIKVQGGALAGATDDIKADREIIMQAAQLGQGSAMQGASPALLADKELVIEAAKLDPSAIKYADENLRNDRDFALSIAGVCGAALQYMPPKFKADPEIVQAAIANDPSAALSAHTSRRTDFNADAPWDSEQINKSVSLSMVTKTPPSSAVLTKFNAQINPVDPSYVYTMKCIKTVFFSGFGTVLGTIGQANYLAANSLLDRIHWTDKPDNEYSTLMWGGVGGQVGMRYKAFGSMDALNAAPENLLTMDDARRILQMVTTCGAPEWMAGSASDYWSRENMLRLSAGYGTGGGWKPPGEDAHVPLDKQLNVQGERKDLGVTKPKVDTAEIGQGPLGGWNFARSLVGEGAEEKLNLEIVEGARVMLTGLDLKRKNGTTGIVIKQMSNGRWKVKMDDDSGFALLPDQCLKCVASAQDAAADVGLVKKENVPEQKQEDQSQQVAEEFGKGQDAEIGKSTKDEAAGGAEAFDC